jgi:hypothetical protein
VITLYDWIVGMEKPRHKTRASVSA